MNIPKIKHMNRLQKFNKVTQRECWELKRKTRWGKLWRYQRWKIIRSMSTIQCVIFYTALLVSNTRFVLTHATTHSMCFCRSHAHNNSIDRNRSVKYLYYLNVIVSNIFEIKMKQRVSKMRSVTETYTHKWLSVFCVWQYHAMKMLFYE